MHNCEVAQKYGIHFDIREDSSNIVITVKTDDITAPAYHTYSGHISQACTCKRRNVAAASYPGFEHGLNG